MTFRSLRPLLAAAALGVAACAGGARPADPAAAPAADPSLAGPQGEVERTTFAPDLNVVLLAMTRLPTGIYYRDIDIGTGVPAAPGREVLVSYVANLADGTEVDRTEPGARPLAFTVGDGVVIRGWDLGVRGMRVGGTRQLVVPSRYAYGTRGTAKVPPNAVMVFVLRLDGVR
ncbi:MAG: FKBP-type peptidyl-prolyl cis-trans isomerase [Gemmatimonadaceae bacterium]|nr:FKBP-type peptidyl-prolyl cis-trans isomerase [Gemmatimonadaceae bacterium]